MFFFVTVKYFPNIAEIISNYWFPLQRVKFLQLCRTKIKHKICIVLWEVTLWSLLFSIIFFLPKRKFPPLKSDEALWIVELVHKYLLYEVLSRRGDELREFKFDVRDVVVGFFVRSGLEGCLPREELEAEDSHAPEVDIVVVGKILHHLWRKVVESSADCLPPVKNNLYNCNCNYWSIFFRGKK